MDSNGAPPSRQGLFAFRKKRLISIKTPRPFLLAWAEVMGKIDVLQ